MSDVSGRSIEGGVFVDGPEEVEGAYPLPVSGLYLDSLEQEQEVPATLEDLEARIERALEQIELFSHGDLNSEVLNRLESLRRTLRGE